MLELIEPVFLEIQQGYQIKSSQAGEGNKWC